ncbi:hypothetical protein HDV00_008167 [Rhizophlyctis rosea]|nr:hypothetical protein HDV00_008167 [Rhizophlyctis rosea]
MCVIQIYIDQIAREYSAWTLKRTTSKASASGTEIHTDGGVNGRRYIRTTPHESNTSLGYYRDSYDSYGGGDEDTAVEEEDAFGRLVERRGGRIGPGKGRRGSVDTALTGGRSDVNGFSGSDVAAAFTYVEGGGLRD